MRCEYRKLAVNVTGCQGAVAQPDTHGIAQLNRLGRDGWEVKQVIPLSQECGHTERVVFIMERSVRRPTVNVQDHPARRTA